MYCVCIYNDIYMYISYLQVYNIYVPYIYDVYLYCIWCLDGVSLEKRSHLDHLDGARDAFIKTYPDWVDRLTDR